jgi:hypothetical protein
MSASSSGHDPPASAAAGPAVQSPPVVHRLTYQVIFRHLARFRDGAHRLLELVRENVPALAEPGEALAPASRGAERPAAIEPEPVTPLELRIERHMSAVDLALIQIHEPNPGLERKAELPPEVRDQIVLWERTTRDIVAAELHFWAAAIENAPVDKFDTVEQAWVRRIISLANRIGVDAEHREYLDFLEDWAAQEHS